MTEYTDDAECEMNVALELANNDSNQNFLIACMLIILDIVTST